MTPEDVPSKAALMGHPIHPVIVPFPIAFLVGALLTDLAFYTTRNEFWALGSMWLVGAGLLSGLLAAIFGLIDFAAVDKVRSHAAAWVHFIGNGIVLLLALVSLLMRVKDPVAAVIPLGMAISIADAALLIVTGWYGGELVYRHRIGLSSGAVTEPKARRAPAPGEAGGRPAGAAG
jgi:uncharacterized membrane protein